VTAQQAPREHRQPIALYNVAELFDKRCCLDLLVEDSFATTQTVVHVVHAALYEDAIVPRHIPFLPPRPTILPQ
jgi:hypothetical protein